MANQLYNTGRSAETINRAGVRSTREDLPIGHWYDDGTRRYRWAHVAMAAWKPGQALRKTQHISGSLAVSARCFSASYTSNFLGSKTVEVFRLSNLTDTSKYLGGTFEVVSGAGVGVYEIEGYEAGTSGGTKATRIYLHQEMLAKLSTGSRAIIRPNAYYGMKPMSAQAQKSGFEAGGATVISGTASGYCYIQTRGIGIGLASGNISAGYPVGIADNSGTLKAVNPAVSTDPPILGHAISGGAKGEYFTMDWKIE